MLVSIHPVIFFFEWIGCQRAAFSKRGSKKTSGIFSPLELAAAGRWFKATSESLGLLGASPVTEQSLDLSWDL